MSSLRQGIFVAAAAAAASVPLAAALSGPASETAAAPVAAEESSALPEALTYRMSPGLGDLMPWWMSKTDLTSRAIATAACPEGELVLGRIPATGMTESLETVTSNTAYPELCTVDTSFSADVTTPANGWVVAQKENEVLPAGIAVPYSVVRSPAAASYALTLVLAGAVAVVVSVLQFLPGKPSGRAVDTRAARTATESVQDELTKAAKLVEAVCAPRPASLVQDGEDLREAIDAAREKVAAVDKALELAPRIAPAEKLDRAARELPVLTALSSGVAALTTTTSILTEFAPGVELGGILALGIGAAATAAAGTVVTKSAAAQGSLGIGALGVAIATFGLITILLLPALVFLHGSMPASGRVALLVVVVLVLVGVTFSVLLPSAATDGESASPA